MNTQSKILVTGASGFLGTYLLNFLRNSGFHQIFALSRRAQPYEQMLDKTINWVQGDLLDMPFIEALAEGMDYVFHCAAVISYDRADAQLMFDTNVLGTEHLVNACLSNRVRKLVFVSSIAAITRQENNLEINENTPWVESKFNTNYGKSKHLAEREVWRGVAEGLNTTIVNPSVILGSGDWKSGSPKLFRTVAEGLRYYPSGSTGFVDVRDVVEFMVKATDPSFDGEQFVINGGNMSWKQFFESVANELNVPPPNTQAGKISSQIARFAAWIRGKITGEKPLITQETIRTSAMRLGYDARKSLESGFSYRPIGHTIAETSTFYLKASDHLLDF